jgi:hypothetical protein
MMSRPPNGLGQWKAVSYNHRLGRANALYFSFCLHIWLIVTGIFPSDRIRRLSASFGPLVQ